MSKIENIVFPVDFSPRSNCAAPFVAEVARRHDAKVTLLAVAQPFYAGGLAGPPMIDPQYILDGVRSELDGAYRAEFADLRVNRLAVLGDPGREIIDFVTANKVDLIMMPTHGHGAFRQLLLGSVTAKVLHDAHVPVWTTAHSGESPDREHLAMRRVLCAVDASPASIGLMRSAANWCKLLGATLRLVHAVPAIETWPEANMYQEFQETVRDNARRTIQDLEKAADIEVPICVGAGLVPDVVREEGVQHKTDLIVIGRGALQDTLGRLRTHSYGIIRNAPCPVLSL